MVKEFEIGMSPKADIRIESIRDLAPEMIKKMYIYNIPKKGGEASALFIPGATTFLGYNHDHPNFKDLEKDGKHNFTYVLPSEILQAYLKNSPSTSFIGTDLDYENSMLIYVEDFFEVKKDDRFFVTFDEPFDLHKFKNREQQAFIVNQGKLITEEFQDLPEEYVEKGNDGASVFSLQSIHTIIDSQSFTNIIPYEWHGDFGFEKNEIRLKFNKEFLLDTIKGLSSNGNILKELEFFNTNESGDMGGTIYPWKVYPAGIDGKLTLFMDWLDGNVILPFDQVSKFHSSGTEDYNGKTLSEITNDTDILALIHTMITLTYGFITGFKNIERNAQGAFDSSYSIGYGTSKINLSAISGQSAISILGGILDSFNMEFPTLMKGNKGKVVRSIVAALSKYIISPASIAGGNNNFNKIFLPWTLDLFEGVTLHKNETTKSWELNKIPKFVMKGNWYGVTLVQTGHSWDHTYKKDAVSNLTVINHSQPFVVNTDYNYVMEELPSVIQPQNLSKAFNPATIDPRNPKELNYVLKIPTSHYINIENLFEGKEQIIPSGKVETITDLPYLPEGLMIFDPDWMKANWHDGYQGRWQDELLKLKAGIFNVYSKQLWFNYSSDWYKIHTTVKQGGPEVEVRESPENFIDTHDKGYTALYLVPPNNLELYYKRKIAERYGVSESDFELTLDRPEHFDAYEKENMPQIISSNTQDVSGVGVANAIHLYLANYLPNHINGDYPMVYQGNGNYYSFNIMGNAMGNNQGDDHENTYPYKCFDKFIGHVVDGSLTDDQVKIIPYRWRLKKATITWNKEVHVGSTLKGDVVISKNQWKEKIKNLSGNISLEGGNYHDVIYSTKIKSDIQDLKLLEIKGVWGDSFKIVNTNNQTINSHNIEPPSKTDETITITRIAFL